MNCPPHQHAVPRTPTSMGLAHLVVLGRELVQALLNHVVAVQILDEHDDVQAQGQDDRVDLQNPQGVSLSSAPCTYRGTLTLACLRVDKKSIIFWTARVPCMFREMLTRSCATDSQMTFRCSSVENSRSFWHK